MFDQRYDTETTYDRIVPQIGPLEAVRRHKLTAVLPVIVALGLAAAYAVERTPTYQAEARQVIGRIDVSQPGALSGFASATKALASSYSRTIVAPAVVNPVARRTGLSPKTVRDRLSASPIPESSVIAVRGTGPSSDQAVALATSGARALDAYIQAINADNPNADRLLRAFRRASLVQSKARQDLDAARKRAGARPSADELKRLARLRERSQTADLNVGVIGQNYNTARKSQSNVAVLQTVSLPQQATSDRSSRLQIALFAGLVAGLLLGVGLATFRSNREVRRALVGG